MRTDRSSWFSLLEGWRWISAPFRRVISLLMTMTGRARPIHYVAGNGRGELRVIGFAHECKSSLGPCRARGARQNWRAFAPVAAAAALESARSGRRGRDFGAPFELCRD